MRSKKKNKKTAKEHKKKTRMRQLHDVPCAHLLGAVTIRARASFGKCMLPLSRNNSDCPVLVSQSAKRTAINLSH